MIKAIVFDLGNVVLTNDWHHVEGFIEEFSRVFNLSEENMDHGFWNNWDEYKVGAISEEVFWERFLKDADASHTDVKKCKAIYKEYQRPINNLFGLIKELKKRYKILALANVGKEWLDWKIDRFNLRDYFDIIIGSGHVGAAKPDKKIYKILLNRAKLKAEECVFIDDMEMNIRAASELGFKTIHFTDRERLEQELKKLGVKL